jgi:tetratricopeptide (TPR) repeat protein
MALVDAWHDAREAAPVADDHVEVTWGLVLAALVGEGSPATQAETLVARAEAAEEPDLLALAWLVVDQVACAEQDLDAAAAAAGRALSVARSDDVRQLARYRVGALALELNHLEEALEHLGQAVSGGEAEARSFAVSALLRMGEVEAAARWAEVARPALERGSPGVAVRQLLLAVEVGEALGHADVVDQRLAEARRLARVVGPFYDYLATANALLVALRRGDLAARTPLLHHLAAHHRDRPIVALASALLEPEARAPVETQVERVRACVEPVAWGVDHEEVADLLELVASSSWSEPGSTALRTLAAEVRQRAGRAVE